MIIESKNFNLYQIANSGQCFRMENIEDGELFSVVAFGKKLYMQQIDKTHVSLECNEEEYNLLWRDYFDMNTDYQAIIDKTTGVIRECADFGSGIRILKQDLWEVIASFIISQNNNIPRIKKSIESLCRIYGTKRIDSMGKEYFTFPSAEVISKLKAVDLAECGLGYRDKYLPFAATWFHTLEVLNINTKAISKGVFMQLPGVGPKVASCIRLFGCHDFSECPIDTHISDWAEEHFAGVGDMVQHMETLGINDYSGVIQQYIFYKELNKC